MKGGKPLHQAQKEHQDVVKLGKCCNCPKQVEKGYHGRWGNSGTCSPECEKEMQDKPKYPGFSEEEYLIRQSEIERH